MYKKPNFWFITVAIVAVIGVLFVLITPAPDELPSTGPHSLHKTLVFIHAVFDARLHLLWDGVRLSFVRTITCVCSKRSVLHLHSPLLAPFCLAFHGAAALVVSCKQIYTGSTGVKDQIRDQEILITAGFYEPFTAVDTIQTLSRLGFEDGDIGVVGVIQGATNELVCFCRSLGIPLDHALYYQTSLEEGGVLLVVRTRELVMKKTALAVLNRQGGLLPPAVQ